MAQAGVRKGVALVESTLLQLQDSGVLASSDPAMARTAPAGGVAAPGVSAEVSPAGSGRYEPVGLLGEGGMGRVEQVRDHDLLRDVAVKHLHPDLLNDSRMLAQFLWEARITAYLDHPNIVPVHDLGLTPQGELFITMKLVRGETLEAVIRTARDGTPNLTQRLRMFLQVCNAIAFAHSRGVLHRDLKPANVMVGQYGEILVSDWGLALPLSNSSGDALREVMPNALVTQSAGTPLYMSPEQVRGDPLDARSDAYALGALLYELTVLRPAFDASSVHELLEQVTSGKVVPITTACSGVSSSLEAVVQKAMALDRAQRYGSVAALASDVEAVLDGHTPSAEKVSLGRRAARYYVASDPLMAKLRVVDIDMWVCSAMFLGAGLALLLMGWITPSPWLGALCLLASALVAIAPTRRWLRLRRRREREVNSPHAS